MSTLNQLVKKSKYKKKNYTSSPALRKNPQKKAICLRCYITTPRKPNSAKRKVARVGIRSFNKKITIAVPGQSHGLQKYGKILIRGGNVRDIPSVRYRAIMGKYDFPI